MVRATKSTTTPSSCAVRSSVASGLDDGSQAVEVARDPRVVLAPGECVLLGLRQPHPVARGALVDGDPVVRHLGQPRAAVGTSHEGEFADVPPPLLLRGVAQPRDELLVELGEEDVLLRALLLLQLLAQRVVSVHLLFPSSRTLAPCSGAPQRQNGARGTRAEVT